MPIVAAPTQPPPNRSGTSSAGDLDQSQPPKTAPAAPKSPRKGPPALPPHILQKAAFAESRSANNSFTLAAAASSGNIEGSTSHHWMNQPQTASTGSPPSQPLVSTVSGTHEEGNSSVTRRGPPALPPSVLKKVNSINLGQGGQQKAPLTPRSRATTGAYTPRETSEPIIVSSVPNTPQLVLASDPKQLEKVSPIRQPAADTPASIVKGKSPITPLSPTKSVTYKQSEGSPSTPKAVASYKARGALRSPLAITRDVTNGHVMYYHVTHDDGREYEDGTPFRNPPRAQYSSVTSPSPQKAWASPTYTSPYRTYSSVDAYDSEPILTNAFVERCTPARAAPRLRSIETVYE